MGTKFSPHKPGPSKNAVYECGLESEGDAWIQFKPGYYLYGIIFLVFDVEAIFLLPFAVAFTGFSLGESIAMLVFLLLLVEGSGLGLSEERSGLDLNASRLELTVHQSRQPIRNQGFQGWMNN